MVNHHLEMTSTALNVSWDQDTLQLTFTAVWNKLLVHLARRELAPPTEPGFSQGFFSVLSPMEFWFLAVVASGLLSWGHFISSDITDLIAQILILNWTELDNDITEFNNEMPLTQKLACFDIMQLLWHNLYCVNLYLQIVKALYK